MKNDKKQRETQQKNLKKQARQQKYKHDPAKWEDKKSKKKKM